MQPTARATSIVFYRGTNDDSPEKTYDLNDVTANGYARPLTSSGA